jgi:alkylated DNA repair dioxygenase AlkB
MDTYIKSTEMTTIILTEKSFLATGFFKDITLVQKCVVDVSVNLVEKPKITVYGKLCCQNRSVGFFSDNSVGYKYSGQIAKSIPLTENLRELLTEINRIFSSDFNGILVNRYTGGGDYIGKHSDNEKELDPKAGVVSLSYGAVRKFRIREKHTKMIEKDILTESGILIQMGGEFQKEFTHEIPVESRVKDTRYSFTFRKHVL